MYHSSFIHSAERYFRIPTCFTFYLIYYPHTQHHPHTSILILLYPPHLPYPLYLQTDSHTSQHLYSSTSTFTTYLHIYQRIPLHSSLVHLTITLIHCLTSFNLISRLISSFTPRQCSKDVLGIS